jgi:hypothetical protein
MQPWFLSGRKRIEPIPFEVACVCGQSIKGIRQEAHQVMACPGCGRQIFILPRSPLPAPRAVEDRGPSVEDQGREARSIRYAWLAGAGAFAIAIVTLAIVFQLSRTNNSNSGHDPGTAAQHFTDGAKLLSQGRFHEAITELDEALALREKQPDALSAADRKSLTQAYREAHLYADLLNESLDDILFQAAAEPDDQEWQAAFADRYKGKGVIFFAGIRRDASDRWVLDYDVFVRDKGARIDWKNLQLLRDLHLNQPQRLLLGVRLANVEPEPGGTWVVRLEPGSGVLITNADAIARVLSRPPEGLEEVLKRQAGWVAEMP